MISLDVNLTPNFNRKMNHELVKKCLEEVIEKSTKEAEKRCRNTCPVDTGNLQRSHAFEIVGEEGVVKNSAEYVSYVVEGTSNMAPQNYPLEVCNGLVSEDYFGKLLDSELRSKGIL